MRTLASVITSIENTIAGKKMLAGQYRENGNVLERAVTLEFLNINIGELERILADLKEIPEK